MAITESKDGRELLQQAEKILLHPIHPHLIGYCPTMDLIALVTDEENLDVYRINGQRAFGLKRKNDEMTVDVIQWAFNGESIAVSWSDGSTDLVSAETGKVSHKDIMLPDELREEGRMDEGKNTARVKCIGWSLNFINDEAVRHSTSSKQRQTPDADTDAFGMPTTDDWDAFKDDTTLEDFLQRQPDASYLDIAPDLPNQLIMRDVEAVLPKLPAIPLAPAQPFMRAVAVDSSGFGTQVEVDSLLHSYHLKSHNSVDVFVRASRRGTTHVSLYDSHEAVKVRLPNHWDVEGTSLLHISHPTSCTHGLLTQVSKPFPGQTNKMAFVPLTLNFIPIAGIYLHIIASKTSQLQNLVVYITQTLARARAFFKHGQDLPSKLMMNVSETLKEKGKGELITNMFHLACTGHCPAIVKEWLVDELAEQGHKRWDNTVTTAYTTLLALLHENLIPALDRCSIVVSRLRGLARFHDRDWIFSGPISDFTSLLDVLQNMRLLAHTTLLYANEEKRQFHAFSKWLRYCIDYEATEHGSQARQEMENRDSGVDIAQVLHYIQYGLTKSDLSPYLKPVSQLDSIPTTREVASYEDTKRSIELLREGASFKAEALCLEHALAHLSVGVTGLLKQVSSWQESNIQMDSGIVLEERSDSEDSEVADMRMVVESSPMKDDTITTYITLSNPSCQSNLTIYRLLHNPSITSLPRDIHTYAISTLKFTNSKVLDAKFADDSNILILLSTDKKERTKAHVLLSLPYLPLPASSPAQQIISYSIIPTTKIKTSLLPNGLAVPAPPSIAVAEYDIERHTRHVFEGRFTPLKLVVNGRKDRRVVVVLGSDRKHYRVLDLDFTKRGDGEEHGEREESESSEEYGGEGLGDVDMGGV